MTQNGTAQDAAGELTPRRFEVQGDTTALDRLLGTAPPAPRPILVPRDIPAEDAASREVLRVVLLHDVRGALADDDAARYVTFARAHGVLALALDDPESEPTDVADSLVVLAALGLAWLEEVDLGLDPGAEVLLRVVAGERHRQRRKHPEATLDLPGLDDPARFVIVAEEVGEVANALTYDEGDTSNLGRELVQVVALALAWLDGIAEREGLA